MIKALLLKFYLLCLLINVTCGFLQEKSTALLITGLIRSLSYTFRTYDAREVSGEVSGEVVQIPESESTNIQIN